ncbi:MAG: DUF262 domain-containing protein [Betaproteobacteria bacterium HGW-Betaproteobacteria-16]|nr:MAG: DUF262 domain-containing protein [Betaproteobacteria bacterium HGW-Betaproteobacteria-16]
MSTKTIENFFTGKTLVIPSYQRDYAWRERNVDDLFADVEEALEAGGGHYLGTFILSQTDKAAPVHVVDGQQRLTTLTMLLDALIAVLQDPEVQQHYRNVFIRHPVSGFKFRVLGDNEEFFRSLLEGQPVQAASDGQERLQAAHRWIRQRVHALVQAGGQETIKRWLQCISQMEVLEFIEPNEGKAIRMFQSVNDRGVPLARMDIVKSLLVYYSNRYLDAQLDEHISKQFGRAFRSFSRIKRLSGEPGFKIRQIDRDAFREDDVLRYHYLAFDASGMGVASGGDYSATSDTVLETFLKPALTALRADKERLEKFILSYTDDLTSFFGALEQLVERTRTDLNAYLLWVVQDLSATLYPLTIRLHLKSWTTLSSPRDSRSLEELLALVDLRVFKLRGTNPQADIFRITRELNTSTVQTVAEDLLAFCERFMPDQLMRSRLVDEDMYRNPAVQRLLLQVEQEERSAVGEVPLDLEAMVSLVREGLTVEHMLPQDPDNSFDIGGYGFADSTDYELMKHRLGNLLLLEGGINSACNNRTVEAKVTAPNLYRASIVCSVRSVAAKCAQPLTRFDRSMLSGRSTSIASQVASNWHL